MRCIQRNLEAGILVWVPKLSTQKSLSNLQGQTVVHENLRRT